MTCQKTEIINPSASKWSCHNAYSEKKTSNNSLALKHGNDVAQIVAIVPSFGKCSIISYNTIMCGEEAKWPADNDHIVPYPRQLISSISLPHFIFIEYSTVQHTGITIRLYGGPSVIARLSLIYKNNELC